MQLSRHSGKGTSQQELRAQQAQDDELAAETEASCCACPCRPWPLQTGGTGLSRQLLLQQALLSNAGVGRLSCNTSLPLALTQTAAPAVPLGATHPTQGPLGLGHTGADQSHAEPNQQHPQETSGPCSGGLWAQGAKPWRRWGSPCAAVALLLPGRGWLGKSTLTQSGVTPAQEGCQRQIPLLAPLFRQSE